MTSGRLTAEQITSSWLRQVATYDQILGDEHLRGFLVANVDMSGSGATLAALEARRANDPDFFAQHDYTWAADPAAYSRPVEAAFQVRALDAAIGLWRWDGVGRVPHSSLERIVVRSTYMSRLEDATPVAKEFEGIAFIVCPMAWPEALEWFFAGLCAYAGADAASTAPGEVWRKFLGGERNEESASRHALRLVANLLASQECPHDVLMPQAVTAIREQIPAFRTAIPELQQSAQSSVSKDLVYLGVEMALCHEVGHILRGDHLPEADVNETAADLLGLIAFINSWEWRHHCLEGLLGNVGRLTLSVASYWHFLPAFYTTIGLVARTIADDGQLTQGRSLHLDQLFSRGTNVMGHLDAYLSQPGNALAWPERTSDQESLELFFETVRGYERVLIETARQLPGTEVRDAVRLAAEQRRE